MHVNRCNEMSVGVEGLVVAFRSKIPCAHCFIIADAEQELTARVKDEPAHPVVMAVECEEELHCCGVPDFDGFVTGARG